jgi:hypothetical protein
MKRYRAYEICNLIPVKELIMEHKGSDFQTSQKKTLGDRVGSTIEKAGQKISDMGAKKIGQKVYDAGDALETHHKNPNHPKDV